MPFLINEKLKAFCHLLPENRNGLYKFENIRIPNFRQFKSRLMYLTKFPK